ncbi:MAG: hypothetical protein J6I64_06595 [Lachnospiraceae bacterium]|nr:hypothetical protein [Lachnospiraceae bacterium]
MAEISSRKAASPRLSAAQTPLRSYQLIEKKYLDTRTSAYTMLGAGTAMLYLSATQFFQMIKEKNLLPCGIFFLVILILAITLFSFGNRSLKQSHELQVQAEQERQLANDLVEWFITTYSAEQIDHQIEAISPLSENTAILCLERLDMIRILLDREYNRSFKEDFIDQVCEDLHNMIFEEEWM